MEKQSKKRSLIIQYFTKDIYIELLKVTMIADATNAERCNMVKEILTKNNIPWGGLGPGTNRMAVLIDGYAVKIALDKDGMIDNRREMLYTKQLQPYVIKVYECVPNGLIAVSEFVRIFTLAEMYEHKDEMYEILEEISTNFLIGDCGITGHNYVNWGTRNDGSICILDFAYIYSVKYNIFSCACDDSAILRYDKKFVDLICPLCGRKYDFGDTRKKITKKQQENEIGDIRRLSYNLTQSEQIVDNVEEFEPQEKKKKKKVLTKEQQLLKDIRSGKFKKQQEDYWEIEPESENKNYKGE